MSTITITRNREGKLVGAGSKDPGAYARFRKWLEEIEPGEIREVSYWASRSGPFHRRHFAILHAVWEQQEQFHEFDQFRLWVQVGAGHVDFLPGPQGKMVAIPKSVAWSKMDEETFRAHHESVMEFLRSMTCTRFLWPQISDEEAADGMERILGEFERDPA